MIADLSSGARVRTRQDATDRAIIPGMGIYERFVETMNACPLSAVKLAERITELGCPVGREKVGGWRKGEYAPNIREIETAVAAAGGDLRWVLTGERSGTGHDAQCRTEKPAAAPAEELTDDERFLVRYLRSAAIDPGSLAEQIIQGREASAGTEAIIRFSGSAKVADAARRFQPKKKPTPGE